MPTSPLSAFSEFRDRFLPASMRGERDGEGMSARAERHRTRRFLAILVVTTAVTALTMVVQLLQRTWLSAAGCAITLALMVGALWSVRRGVPVRGVGSVLVALGFIVALALGVLAGPVGLTSLFWASLAPTLFLTLAGARAGRWALLVAGALIGLASVVMLEGLVPPMIDPRLGVGAHTGSLLGAMLAYFALTWAYERETLANVAELEKKNAELLVANQKAEAASRAKGEFLAAMSHEIRTPMNGVLGMTSVMLAGELPEAVRDGLVTIKTSGDSLQVLLADVLDFSRIESGTLTIEQVAVDVRGELREVSGLLESLAAERSNRIVVRSDDALPRWVLSDPLRLRQIAINLVSNAIKFTKGGEVRVDARYADGALELHVEDTGIGIAPHLHASIFEPFRQADASTTRRFGGSGLGLAIVHRLVRALDGTIALESEPGRGSRFSVTLPAPPCKPPKASQERQPSAGRSLKILLAEDNDINRKVAQMFLRDAGHVVTPVENGLLAMSAVEREEFDLVLMDCFMPELDGFEATRRLRALGKTVPIVALTAASLPEERKRCLEAGMNAVLLKPLDVPKLRAVLENLGAA